MGRPLEAEAFKALEALDILKTQLAAMNETSEDTLLISVESQTNVFEIMNDLVVADAELDASIVKNDTLAKSFAERRDRLKERKKKLRSLLDIVMDRMGLAKVPGPFGTITRRRNGENIEIIDEKLIPSEFWKLPEPQDPVLDRALLKETFITLYKQRETHIAFHRSAYEDEINLALALPEASRERAEALAAIDRKLAPAMRKLERELPLPPGVQMAEPGYSISVRRT